MGIAVQAMLPKPPFTQDRINEDDRPLPGRHLSSDVLFGLSVLPVTGVARRSYTTLFAEPRPWRLWAMRIDKTE